MFLPDSAFVWVTPFIWLHCLGIVDFFAIEKTNFTPPVHSQCAVLQKQEVSNAWRQKKRQADWNLSFQSSIWRKNSTNVKHGHASRSCLSCIRNRSALNQGLNVWVRKSSELCCLLVWRQSARCSPVTENTFSRFSRHAAASSGHEMFSYPVSAWLYTAVRKQWVTTMLCAGVQREMELQRWRRKEGREKERQINK